LFAAQNDAVCLIFIPVRNYMSPLFVVLKRQVILTKNNLARRKLDESKDSTSTSPYISSFMNMTSKMS